MGQRYYHHGTDETPPASSRVKQSVVPQSQNLAPLAANTCAYPCQQHWQSFTNLVVIREVLRGRPCRLAGAARDLKNRSATRGHGAITQSNRESAEKIIRGLDRPWKVQFISVHNEQNQMYRRLVKRHHHKLVCLSAWRRKAKQNGTKL